jgi:hypothetical protein
MNRPHAAHRSAFLIAVDVIMGPPQPGQGGVVDDFSFRVRSWPPSPPIAGERESNANANCYVSV